MTELGRCFSTSLVHTQKIYIFFCNIDLVEFVGFMSLGGLAASTITTYISDVRHKLKLMGKEDFQQSFLLKLVL